MSEILEQVFKKIETAHKNGLKTITVFDLDSTLFDVNPRLEKVLLDFADVKVHQERFPEQIQHFKNIKAHRTDWGIRKTLIRAGLTHADPEFQNAVKDFWRKNFFSNEYLVYDVPYDGAVEYVQQLFTLGAEIHYLTGRDEKRMGQGSRDVLRKWGFPLDEVRAHLALKPRQGMDDGLFKRDWFVHLNHQDYKEIWFFENEPVNINWIARTSPHVNIVFFDSTHQGLEEAPANIPKIMNFLCGIKN